MVILWLDLFNYLRAYHKGTALVELLVEIMIDMIYFVGVTAVLIFAFAFGFFALHGNLTPATLYGEEAGWTEEQTAYAESNFRFSKLEQCIARTFTFAVLGSFDIDSFRSPVDMDSQGLLTNLSSAFFLLAAFLITIVALNALIAIMGNTYNRVAAQEKAVVYKEIASVLQDKVRLYVQDKEHFKVFTRWTHVLSPSETGSIALGVGRKREEANIRRTLVAVSQDTKAIQRDLEGFRSQPEEVAKMVEEQLEAHANAAQLENARAISKTLADLVPDLRSCVRQEVSADLRAVAEQVKVVDRKLEERLGMMQRRLEARLEEVLGTVLQSVSGLERAIADRPKPGVAVSPLSSFPLVVVAGDRSPAMSRPSPRAGKST